MQHGLRECREHVDIKALLINTIRFSWEVCSVLRVQGCRAQGSAAVCLLLFAHWPFSILPFETQRSKLEEKKKTGSTAELIFMVYREYTGISWPKKANLASVTQKIMCLPPFSVSLHFSHEYNVRSLEESKNQLYEQ